MVREVVGEIVDDIFEDEKFADPTSPHANLVQEGHAGKNGLELTNTSVPVIDNIVEEDIETSIEFGTNSRTGSRTVVSEQFDVVTIAAYCPVTVGWYP